VYPIYDSFGNTIVTIGTVNNDTLIRRVDDINAQPGFYNDSALVRSSIVNLQTTYGTIFIRYPVLQNTTSYLNIIQRYQNASSLTKIPRQASYVPSPPIPAQQRITSESCPTGSLLGINTPSKLLDFLSRFVMYYRPEQASER
jgi:hypothetical protein